MAGLAIQNGEWVVVCDGAKALVLENSGDSKFPDLKTIEVFEQKSGKTHELGTDAPGRSHQSAGYGRSAMEQTDWHSQTEEAFLLKVVEYLEAAVAAGRVKSMVMVAPPRALGLIRPVWSQGLRSVVRDEVDKDLVKLPVREIERHLTVG
jgi:protein required for attachment to host cells